MNCGTRLNRVCANCGAPLPAGARFCLSCGQPAEGAAAADKAPGSLPLASDPSPLVEKVRAAHLAGERRVVTVLFADVVDSTALTASMDPEDWTSVMNLVFDRLSPAVDRFGGTIARLMGDALLAFFGAPVAHEDDPVRAVNAALAMLDVAGELARDLKRRYKIEFAIRVGLNTGLVVVGEVGSDLINEYTAMGDAVNIAARLQSAARPMTVLTSENTYRFVEPLFRAVDLGLLEVRGMDEAVRVFEVIEAKSGPGRVRSRDGFRSPMVGRDRELSALEGLSADVHVGVGRIAWVHGEPGIGKSRLIAEWKAAEERAGGSIRWIEGHGLSYGQGLAYHLFIDGLRSLIGASASTPELEARAALDGLVGDLFGPEALEVYPYLGHLLSLQLEGEALERVQHLDPQGLQANYLAASRRLFSRLGERHPLALVFDDIQWADPSSTELIAKLLPMISEAPILFCIVGRFEPDAPGWKLVGAARGAAGEELLELTLQPLSEAGSERLISNLLGLEQVPASIRTLILNKAEGNPLFVEEVTRMLIEHGSLVKQGEGWVERGGATSVDIPDSLHSLMLARIDRLPEEVKHVLRLASVIGRRFSMDVLKEVLERDV